MQVRCNTNHSSLRVAVSSFKSGDFFNVLQGTLMDESPKVSDLHVHLSDPVRRARPKFPLPIQGPTLVLPHRPPPHRLLILLPPPTQLLLLPLLRVLLQW